MMLITTTLYMLLMLSCHWLSHLQSCGSFGLTITSQVLAAIELDVSSKTPARQWIAGVYFCVMLLTTTGLGDIKPVSPPEEVLASIQMLMGVFLFGLIVSTSQ